jgi:hypothetical protein
VEKKMANFATVNRAIKMIYPQLDIKAVRGDGYVYFDGNDGYNKIESIMAHPVSTNTTDLRMMVLFLIDEKL